MTVAPDSFTLRPLAPDDFESYYTHVMTAFHDAADDARAHERSVFEFDRSIGVFDAGHLIGSAGIFTRDLTLPGGPRPVAAVTAVAVAAGYTRRGVLTRMMRHQLTQLYEEEREPVAALWASESGIYGRFGYGLAARHARMTVKNRDVRVTSGVDRSVRVGDATDESLRGDVAAVYEHARRATVGHLDRLGEWWDFRLYDPETDRSGATPLRIVVHDGADGPDGYAIFSVKSRWDDDGPFGTVVIREMTTTAPAAESSLWSFLLNLDLVGEVTARIVPTDTPLPLLVDHPRRVALTLGDNLWVRVVDVPRALAARSYSVDVDVTLEVDDAFCPWNTGRWRLRGGPGGATCERVTAAADLILASTDLGAAFLGGTSLAALAAAGRVAARDPEALRRATTAFAEPRAPFCPEVF